MERDTQVGWSGIGVGIGIGMLVCCVYVILNSPLRLQRYIAYRLCPGVLFFSSFHSAPTSIKDINLKRKIAWNGVHRATGFLVLCFPCLSTLSYLLHCSRHSTSTSASCGTKSTVRWAIWAGSPSCPNSALSTRFRKERQGHTKVFIYAQEKREQEEICLLFAHLHTGIRTLHLRICSLSRRSGYLLGHRTPLAGRKLFATPSLPGRDEDRCYPHQERIWTK